MKISTTFWLNAPKRPPEPPLLTASAFDEGHYEGRKYIQSTGFYWAMKKLMEYPHRLTKEQAIAQVKAENERQWAVFRPLHAQWVKDLNAYIASFGPKFKGEIAGGIGQGDRTHRLGIDYVKCPDGAGILSATSTCGSRKWTIHGASALIPTELPLSSVNCDKCLGRRTPGGKQPKQYKCEKCGRTGSFGSFVDDRGWVVRRYKCPQCGSTDRPEAMEPGKRPQIDPMSRPRDFVFMVKVRRVNYQGQPWIQDDRERAKGMTEEEAWKKVERNLLRFTREDPVAYGVTEILDHELVAIFAWNGKLLWRKES